MQISTRYVKSTSLFIKYHLVRSVMALKIRPFHYCFNSVMKQAMAEGGGGTPKKRIPKPQSHLFVWKVGGGVILCQWDLVVPMSHAHL